MKTMTRRDAINELVKREYDALRSMFSEESKNIMLPLIEDGLGGFGKMTNSKLEDCFRVLHDEIIEITN